jgi:hypothetical protein
MTIDLTPEEVATLRMAVNRYASDCAREDASAEGGEVAAAWRREYHRARSMSDRLMQLAERPWSASELLANMLEQETER